MFHFKLYVLDVFFFFLSVPSVSVISTKERIQRKREKKQMECEDYDEERNHQLFFLIIISFIRRNNNNYIRIVI